MRRSKRTRRELGSLGRTQVRTQGAVDGIGREGRFGSRVSGSVEGRSRYIPVGEPSKAGETLIFHPMAWDRFAGYPFDASAEPPWQTNVEVNVDYSVPLWKQAPPPGVKLGTRFELSSVAGFPRHAPVWRVRPTRDFSAVTAHPHNIAKSITLSADEPANLRVRAVISLKAEANSRVQVEIGSSGFGAGQRWILRLDTGTHFNESFGAASFVNPTLTEFNMGSGVHKFYCECDIVTAASANLAVRVHFMEGASDTLSFVANDTSAIFLQDLCVLAIDGRHTVKIEDRQLTKGQNVIGITRGGPFTLQLARDIGFNKTLLIQDELGYGGTSNITLDPT